jgi:hypothetical protein
MSRRRSNGPREWAGGAGVSDPEVQRDVSRCLGGGGDTVGGDAGITWTRSASVPGGNSRVRCAPLCRQDLQPQPAPWAFGALWNRHRRSFAADGWIRRIAYAFSSPVALAPSWRGFVSGRGIDRLSTPPQFWTFQRRAICGGVRRCCRGTFSNGGTVRGRLVLLGVRYARLPDRTDNAATSTIRGSGSAGSSRRQPQVSELLMAAPNGTVSG